MPGPTDAASVALVDSGELLVIDGRNTPWWFVPGKAKPKVPGQKVSEPAGFKAAWARSDRLYVIDSANTAWAYDFASGLWAKGPKVDAVATEPPQEGSWQYGPVLLPVQEDAEAA